MADAENSEVVDEIKAEVHRFDRAKRVGKNILAATAGLGVAVGATYVGYKIGTDVVGPENGSNSLMYYPGIVLPTAILGGLGISGGFYAAAAIADSEPL